MLDAHAPLALIYRAVGPEHLSIPVTLIVLIVALIDVPALPREHSVAIFSIVTILAVVLIARSGGIRLLLPFPLAMLEAFLEVTDIHAATLPLVLSVSVWLATFVRSCKGIPIGEYVSSLTVFEAVSPLAFISITIFPLMDAVPVGFTVLPLAYV